MYFLSHEVGGLAQKWASGILENLGVKYPDSFLVPPLSTYQNKCERGADAVAALDKSAPQDRFRHTYKNDVAVPAIMTPRPNKSKIS